jgi:hypothetical protein
MNAGRSSVSGAGQRYLSRTYTGDASTRHPDRNSAQSTA